MPTVHPRTLPDGRIPVLLSAHARDLLQAEAGGLRRYLESGSGRISVAAVAQMLHRVRQPRRYRAVIRAGDAAELAAGLDAVYRDADHPLVARSARPDPACTAFVFPGQGSRWPGMAAGLFDLGAYRDEAERCDEAVRRAGHPSPLAYLRGTDTFDADPVLVQAAQLTHAAALAATWRAWGVLPDVTVGHSLGELAAAYTARVIDLDAAVAVVAARAQVTANPPGRFGMAMLGIGADAAGGLIGGVAGWLELSAINGAGSVVVAGELDAIHDAVRLAGERGVFARELPVGYPAHTSALTALRERMLDLVPEAQFHHSPVQFIGSAFGGPIPRDLTFRRYWYESLRRQVRFDLAVATAVAAGATAFIEMSAHPTLLIALEDGAGDAQALGSTARDHPAVETLSANIVAAAVADPHYRWRDFAPPATGLPLRHFPHAPMHTTRLWAGTEPLPDRDADAPVVMAEHWLAADTTASTPAASVAVADYSGESAALAARLTAVLTADPRTEIVDTDRAELLVLVAPTTSEADIATAAATFAQVAISQAAVPVGADTRRVWLVTAQAEQTGVDPVPRAGAAALAALHRSIGFGYPDQTFAHLDLPAQPTAADLRVVVTALLLAETEVAVRAAQPLVRRLRPAEPAPAVDDPLPETVVITGGTGAIGLAYAAYCAEHGARDITLISRTGATGATAARLEAIGRTTGARITAIRCDLTDARSLNEVVAQHRPSPAGLVVHTAAAEAVAADAITSAAVRDAFGAKVVGLHNLTRAWPLRADPTVLVCSSVLALWGGSGHGLYAASNRMADVLTAQLRADGLNAKSIRWGLWQAVAVVTGAERDRIARVGLTPMNPAAAVAAGFAAQPPDPVILAADWDRLAVFFDTQGVTRPFPSPGDAAMSAATPGCALPELVAAELAAVLGIDDAADIEMRRSLVDLGLDSLLALDLRKRLGRATGRRVALAPLLAGITGAQLVTTLSDDATPRQAPERTALAHD